MDWVKAEGFESLADTDQLDLGSAPTNKFNILLIVFKNVYEIEVK